MLKGSGSLARTFYRGIGSGCRMLRQDLIFALRGLGRRPFQSAVRLVVLALGLFCFIAAHLFVGYFRGYDGNWAKADRIYALFEGIDTPQVGLHVPPRPFVTPELAEQLRLDVPELEAVARYRFLQGAVTAGGESRPARIATADPDFLDIFDFAVAAGDLRGALSKPRSAVMTESAARRLFGTIDAVGRTLSARSRGGADATVTAVIRDPPQHSHLGGGRFNRGFDLLVSSDLWEAVAGPSLGRSEWYDRSVLTYALLAPDGSLGVDELDRRLEATLARHAPPRVPRETLSIEARPVSAIAIDGMLETMQFSGGQDWRYDVLDVLQLFAAAVLAIAIVNFVNLETAGASERAKEIGIRRTLGATPWQVAFQSLVRAGVFVIAGALLGLAAVTPLHRLFPDYWQPALAAPWTERGFWLFLTAVVAGVTFLTGFYPALVLARIRPFGALRLGALRAGPKILRSLLVASQFAGAAFLVAAVIVLYSQSKALRHALLGRFEDQYVLVQTPPSSAGGRDALVNELLRGRGIKGVTGTASYPWVNQGPKPGFQRTIGEASSSVPMISLVIGNDYFDVMNVPLLAGRVLSRDLDDVGTVSAPEMKARSRPVRVVLDRKAARALGWAKPEDALGALLYRFGLSDQVHEVIGVVESVPAGVLDAGGEGTVYYLNPAQAAITLVRIAPDETQAALAHIDAVMKAIYHTDRRGSYAFLDDVFSALYRQFQMINTAIAVLGALAVAIAGIGLLGLASYLTGRRTREIGLRKSQGARSTQILTLLLRQFLKPVLAANLVAWPFIYIAAKSYLSVFDTHIAVTPKPFLLALIGTVAIAIFAVSSRVLHAASIKPAEALRHE